VIGEVAYAELNKHGHLDVVSVVDGDWPQHVDENLYYSGLFYCRGTAGELSGDTWAAERAHLIGMSLTLSPASLEAQPLRIMAGDVRSSVDRFKWPGDLHHHAPLLERAVAYLPRGETRARRITDQRPAERTYLSLREGQRVMPGEFPSRYLPGGLMKSAHVGRVISVR
jgi:hypothetical protein